MYTSERLRIPPVILWLSLSLLGQWTSMGFAQTPNHIPDTAKVEHTNPNPTIEEIAGATPPPTTPLAPPDVALECTPNPAPIGAPVSCLISVIHSPQQTVLVTPPAGAEEGSATLPTATKNGMLLTTRRFILRGKKLDRPIRIKGVRVSWEGVGGQQGTVSVPDQKIPIKPSIIGISDPKPKTFKNPLGLSEEGIQEKTPEEQKAASNRYWSIHGLLPLEVLNWPLIIALLLIVATALAFGLGWMIGKIAEARRRARAPWVDPRPAHVIALAELQALQNEGLITAGEYKRYYQRLSEVIRGYFERRYDFSALEMTTDEINTHLSARKITREAMVSVEDFMLDADLVKFADFNPSEQAIDRIYTQALTVIKLTKLEEDELDSSSSTSSASHHDEPSNVADVPVAGKLQPNHSISETDRPTQQPEQLNDDRDQNDDVDQNDDRDQNNDVDQNDDRDQNNDRDQVDIRHSEGAQ